jgi:hypothetical protein
MKSDSSSKRVSGEGWQTTGRSRLDGQLSGLAGEFFVAAELLRRGHQVAVTMGNAKAVDLFVQNEAGDSFAVQVKTLRRSNAFIISPNRVSARHIYAFVILNDISERPTFFLVRGRDLLDQKDSFWPRAEKLPGFGPKRLHAHKDAWFLFEDGKHAAGSAV